MSVLQTAAAILVLAVIVVAQGCASKHTGSKVPDEILYLAQNGDPDAQYRLGKVYLDGNGVEANDDSAFYWLEEAAANGSQPARDFLESIYEPIATMTVFSIERPIYGDQKKLEPIWDTFLNVDFYGRGTPDYIRYIRRMAEAEHPWAVNRLADHYYNGIFATKDLNKAMELYERAIDLMYEQSHPKDEG